MASKNWIKGVDYPEWMKGRSLATLQGGYLVGNETPKDAMMRIATRVDELIPSNVYEGNLKEAVFNALWNQEISPSSPVWSNFGLPRGLPISCLTGDSWINTKHEGGTRIKDLKVGDLVLTHEGRWKTVIDKQSRMSSDDLYELKIISRRTPLRITGNHPVLTNLGWVRVDKLTSGIHYIATNTKIEYEEKKGHITVSNYFNNSINAGRFEPTQIPSPIEIDKNLSWALGLWFAEGSLSTDTHKKPNGIRITLGVDFKKDGDRFLSIMEEKFGLKGNFYYSEIERNGKINKWYNFNINSTILGDYFLNTFGKNCKVKNIPGFIKDLPKEELKEFFDGFYLGDGSKTKKTDTIVLSNPKLILSLYEIGLKLGYRLSLHMEEKAGKYGTTPYAYSLRILCKQGKITLSPNNARSGIELPDGNRYFPFEIKKLTHNETVYDITVEDDHSFSVAGVVVHNCYGSHIQDSISGIYSSLAENAKMSQLGGGSSSYWGDIRPRGSSISNQHGTTGGPYEFLPNYDVMINKVSQGSCYQEGTEVLTDKGFKDFRDVNNKEDLLAQLDEKNNITWTNNYDLTVNNFSGDLIKIKGKKQDSLVSIGVTPNHRMVIERLSRDGGVKSWKGFTEIVKAEDLKLNRDNRMFFSGNLPDKGNKLSAIEKLRIAFQADGRKDAPGRAASFYLSKTIKIDRLISLLEEAGKDYYLKNYENSTFISVKDCKDFKHNTLEWVNLSSIDLSWSIEFLEEVSLWDGSKNKNRSSISYSSVNRINVDIIQSVSSLCGKRSRVSLKSNIKDKQVDLHTIIISDVNKIQGGSCEIYKEAYKGKVYCAVVPQGRLLVRFEGRTLVCGNTRRGSHAVYMDFSHPDVEEFLEIKQVGSPIQNLFYAICIGQEDREAIYSGDSRALKIWSKILESRNNTGIPYLFFKDNVNDGPTTPPWYGLNKSQIKASNLCITGDQRVVSSLGYLTAKELYLSGEKLVLFDGEKEVKSSEMKLREKDADVFKITLANGLEHKVTSYHGIPVIDSKGNRVRKTYSELSLGDKIEIQIKKGLFGKNNEVEKAYILGLDQSNSIYTGKLEVPEWIFKSDEETVRAYFKILLEENSIETGNINLGFLKDLNLLLTNLGLQTNLEQGDSFSKLSVLPNPLPYSEVIKLEYVGKEDVYCPTVESSDHIFACQGLLTYNCSEIFLPSNEYESFVCCLINRRLN